MVAGGKAGIGRIIATSLVGAGALVVTGRDAEGAARVATLISAERCCWAAVDLGHDAGPAQLAAVAEQFGDRLDILVNNAGMEGRPPVNDFTRNAWDAVVDVHLSGTFFVTQALLAALRAPGTAERPSQVIHIGSIGELLVVAVENYAHEASKAAVHHLTRTLSRRLAGEHILVNAIAPGIFTTRMIDEMPEAFVATVRDAQPLSASATPTILRAPPCSWPRAPVGTSTVSCSRWKEVISPACSCLPTTLKTIAAGPGSRRCRCVPSRL